MQSSFYPLKGAIVCIQWMVLFGILFSVQNILFNFCFKRGGGGGEIHIFSKFFY